MDLLLKIITTIATLGIGVAASILAYQQYKISKTKLAFELYDKRYALFFTLRLYVSDLAIRDANPPLESLGNAGQFKRDTIESRFLFEKDVVAYFDDVYTKAAKLRLSLERPNLTEEEQKEIKNEISTLRIWFFDQSDAMFNVFRESLSIKVLK